MRNGNKTHYYLLLLFPLLFSCGESSDGRSEKKENVPYRKNLINPYYIDQILNTPNNFGSIWNASNIRQIVVDKISIVLKGGSNPDDIIEKYIFTFDSLGNNDNYSYYHYQNSQDVINQTNFQYHGKDIYKINVYRYFGVGNLPPTFVNQTPERTIFYKSKSNGKNDSLFFYPNAQKPKIIIDKIGNFVSRLEIFVPEGTPRSKIMSQLQAVDTNLTQYELTDKMLTYTNNGFPVESYHLGENWNHLERAKLWEYNKYKQPISFKEWMHGTLIKSISIQYNENALPKKIIYNRNKYLLNYHKN